MTPIPAAPPVSSVAQRPATPAPAAGPTAPGASTDAAARGARSSGDVTTPGSTAPARRAGRRRGRQARRASTVRVAGAPCARGARVRDVSACSAPGAADALPHDEQSGDGRCVAPTRDAPTDLWIWAGPAGRAGADAAAHGERPDASEGDDCTDHTRRSPCANELRSRCWTDAAATDADTGVLRSRRAERGCCFNRYFRPHGSPSPSGGSGACRFTGDVLDTGRSGGGCTDAPGDGLGRARGASPAGRTRPGQPADARRSRCRGDTAARTLEPDDATGLDTRTDTRGFDLRAGRSRKRTTSTGHAPRLA